MKHFWRVVIIAVAIVISFVAGTLVFPAQMARAAIILADEVSVQRVFVNAIDAPARQAPVPISLRGDKLNWVRRDIKIINGKGAYCMCDGDFHLDFKRFGLTLTSFRGHLSETPPRLIAGQPLSLEPKAAQRLAAYFQQIAPR